MKKHYIVDTNVLIDNPDAIRILRNGEENNVYIPYHVLSELDNLKKDKRLGIQASMALKAIEDYKDIVNFIRNDKSQSHYTDNVDKLILDEILAEKDLQKKGILITADRLMRMNAESMDIQTDDFISAIPYLTDSEVQTGFFEDGQDPVVNNFVWRDGKPHYYTDNGEYEAITFEHDPWNIKPKNVYQNLALHLFLNQNLDIVTIQSAAGYGKTFLALAAAFYLAYENKNAPQKKIVVTKAVHEIGEKMGALPGTLDEKFAPSIRSITDLAMKLHYGRAANKIFMDPKAHPLVFNPKKFEILPLAYIQGINIENSILIIDEAQNLTRKEMRAIATRCGKDTRLFAIGDTRQVINPYISEHNNGLNWLVKLCYGKSNYGHMVLKGKESRGPVTDLILDVGL